MAALAPRTRQTPIRREQRMTIDVIVPVYRGVEATRRCIESVLSTALSSKQQTPFELIAVNDACPEPELVRWLRELAERSRLTLIEQPLRQGFAAAVNRATALHPERDVVILHSDAEVANDWLDRLVAPASAARDIGTVVPFTNYGGIAGYPRTDVRNAMPRWTSCFAAPMRTPRSQRR